MKKTSGILFGVVFSTICLFNPHVQANTNDQLLQQAIDGKHRLPDNIKRDQYRNPFKTLSLFDIQPHHTVVEVWPGGGWYTEILASYLREQGQLIAAQYDPNDQQASYRPRVRARFEQKMAQQPQIYDKVSVTSLMFDEQQGTLAKPAAANNSVDRVVTFRSTHGMYHNGTLDAALAHYFSILKSGGKLGLVQHQADETQNWRKDNIGYIARSHIIAAAIKAGFVLEAEGYFNHNPHDSRRHKIGVWQLPPSLNGSKTPEEKAHYQEIGESHRMTLVFTKP